MSVPSFDQRRANINTLDDLDDELRKAKLYVRRARLTAKQAVSLDQKLKLQENVKDAERVLRTLRLRYFDIEDELLQQTGTI